MVELASLDYTPISYIEVNIYVPTGKQKVVKEAQICNKSMASYGGPKLTRLPN